MKNIFKSIISKAAKGQDKTVSDAILATIIGFILFLSIMTIVPLLLVFGISLLGFPIVVGFKSWIGSVLIIIYLIAIRKAGTDSNNKTN